MTEKRPRYDLPPGDYTMADLRREWVKLEMEKLDRRDERDLSNTSAMVAIVAFGVVLVLALGLVRGFMLLIERPVQPHTPEQFQNPNLPKVFRR